MLLSCVAELRRQGKEWRNAAPLRAGAQPDDLRDRPDEPASSTASRTSTSSAATRSPSRSSCEGDRLHALRRRARQPAVLDQAVGPRRLRRPTRGAATCTARRRRAAPTTPSGSTSCASLEPETGRCAILFPHGVLFRDEEARDAAQAHRGRPDRVRPRPRAEPLLQLADGSLRRRLPHGQAQGAARVAFSSSTPSTKSPASAPRASSPTSTSSGSSKPTSGSRTSPASPAWPRGRKSAPRTATSAFRCTSRRRENEARETGAEYRVGGVAGGSGGVAGSSRRCDSAGQPGRNGQKPNRP